MCIQRRISPVAWLVPVAAPSGFVLAQPVPNYGFEWRTVGAAGNRDTNPDEVWLNPGLRIGAVGYEYRLTRTEVTTAQYFEFLTAYAPYVTESPYSTEVRGPWIIYTASDGFQMYPGAENYPTEMGWRMAARMCNWLHNGKSGEAWAFTTGAYDTSTFTANPDGTFNDGDRLPGAQFWIPTQDEWTKAMYYDPNRHGAGVDGYWEYPNRSNDPLVAGLPGSGAQTSAGHGIGVAQFPVGSYPDTFSPWGFMDASGGVREWLGDWMPPEFPGHGRGVRGSMTGGFGPDQDWLPLTDPSNPRGASAGLRIASVVPAPSIVLCFAVSALGFARRRQP
ncbi:MAG: hypothetical protein HBSAPP03_13650 [Phycisphaerae bacterium]|nr:MAG: hypothetical protein HBSAPP03_13650 [Phycisphaerae bacterium]